MRGAEDLGSFDVEPLGQEEGSFITTKLFYCPSRSTTTFVAQCKGCEIDFGLQGMTSASTSSTTFTSGVEVADLFEPLASSSMSVNKTGFSIMQYEALECAE
jgi:hypothetical protein